MKRVLALSIVQGLLGWLVWLYASVLIRTLRWRIDNPTTIETAVGSSEGAMALFWHGRLAHAIACLPLLRDKPRRVLISLSRDGEFIAAGARRLGIPAIRGSAEKAGPFAEKGGAAALRRSRRFIGEGGVLLVTPDGPRGPTEVIPRSQIQLARMAACPVFLLGLAAEPAVKLRSWDSMRLPLPFARARLALEGPLTIPAKLDPEGAETLRLDWQSRMRLAQARAEAALADPPN
ncbi:MAG: lysophospholipid acyltransferase family protein [Caulobacteraceae bacterium]